MTAAGVLKMAWGYLWRLGFCAAAMVIGTAVGRAMLTALGMPVPQSPEQTSEQVAGLLLFVASFLQGAGLIPLARRLQGPFWLRWLALALLCYVCLGIAAPLEGVIFTSLQGMESIPVLFLPPCLLFAAAMAMLFKPAQMSDSPLATIRRFCRGWSLRQWAGRFALALLAFPVVYWTFGLMVAPFVMKFYQQGQFALSVPNPGVIIFTQFLRGALFLAASVPILVLWSGSRRRLVLALGLAFYVLVGLFGMMQSYWLAPTLQILHNTEILADSMVYAWVITRLLVGERKSESHECAPLNMEPVAVAR